jgi:hypothetical protein
MVQGYLQYTHSEAMFAASSMAAVQSSMIVAEIARSSRQALRIKRTLHGPIWNLGLRFLFLDLAYPKIKPSSGLVRSPPSAFLENTIDLAVHVIYWARRCDPSN